MIEEGRSSVATGIIRQGSAENKYYVGTFSLVETTTYNLLTRQFVIIHTITKRLEIPVIKLY